MQTNYNEQRAQSMLALVHSVLVHVDTHTHTYSTLHLLYSSKTNDSTLQFEIKIYVIPLLASYALAVHCVAQNVILFWAGASFVYVKNELLMVSGIEQA